MQPAVLRVCKTVCCFTPPPLLSSFQLMLRLAQSTLEFRVFRSRGDSEKGHIDLAFHNCSLKEVCSSASSSPTRIHVSRFCYLTIEVRVCIEFISELVNRFQLAVNFPFESFTATFENVPSPCNIFNCAMTFFDTKSWSIVLYNFTLEELIKRVFFYNYIILRIPDQILGKSVSRLLTVWKEVKFDWFP